jgi:inorganic triphosphatase YgiF
MTIEVEAKLKVPDETARKKLPAALQNLGFQITDQGHHSLEDVYVDTEGHGLEKDGWALRFRKSSGTPGWTRTLKALTPPESGLAQREELEKRVADIETYWEGEKLLETFRVHQERDWFFIERTAAKNQDVILRVEASYDFVQWKAKAEKEPEHLVELELKLGKAEDLLNLAQELCSATGWELSHSSKFLRSLPHANETP